MPDLNTSSPQEADQPSRHDPRLAFDCLRLATQSDIRDALIPVPNEGIGKTLARAKAYYDFAANGVVPQDTGASG